MRSDSPHVDSVRIGLNLGHAADVTELLDEWKTRTSGRSEVGL